MKKLYKYMSLYSKKEKDIKILNPNTINSIEKANLFFSNADSFNDPFELRPQFDFNFTDQEFLHKQKMIHMKKLPHKSESEIEEELKYIVKNNIHRSHDYWAPFIENLTKQIRDDVGILCLSSDPENILMWSHYAQQHNGICLGFSWSANTEFFGEAQEVHYETSLPHINMFDENIMKQLDQMFFTKHEGWHYEKEWRIINIDGSGLYTYPKDLLASVTFGLRTDEEDKNLIMDIARKVNNNVQFYQCIQNQNKYKIDVVEIQPKT